MSKPEIDLSKIQISDEVRDQIKVLAKKHKNLITDRSGKEGTDSGSNDGISIDPQKAGLDTMSFEIIYYLFGVSNLTLMMKYYNNNLDLYLLSCIFLSKRMFVNNLITAKENKTENSVLSTLLMVLKSFLTLWFLFLLIKICMYSSLESALLLIYPIITWILMVKFTSKKYVQNTFQLMPIPTPFNKCQLQNIPVRCKHPNCSKSQDDANSCIE